MSHDAKRSSAGNRRALEMSLDGDTATVAEGCAIVPDATTVARLAIFETLVERTGPTPSARCTCDRCYYSSLRVAS